MRPLLPLPGTTIVEALLTTLFTACKGTCTICTNGNTELIAGQVSWNAALASRVGFHDDPVPRGAAGCIKACEPVVRGDVIIVVGAAVWLDDDPSWMLEQHREQGNALTVFCSRGVAEGEARRNGRLKPVGVYCCDPAVLDFIPAGGYQDLKEQLVPALQRAGLRVGTVIVRGGTCEVSSWASYMNVLSRALSSAALNGQGYDRVAPGIWYGRGVEIAPRARVVGPALLGHGCRLDDGAVVLGPAMLGDGVHVGRGSWLIRVVAPPGTRFPAAATVVDQLLPSPAPEPATTPPTDAAEAVREPPPLSPHEPSSVNETTREGSRRARTARAWTSGVVLLVGLFVWAFWHTFVDLWHVWQSNADYGVGQLVPLAAAYMIFVRRRTLRGISPGLGPLGLCLFGAGLGMNLLGGYYLYSSLANAGVVVCANGLAMSLLGWRGYKRMWYPFLFLFLMMPLPCRIRDAVMLPLQGFGVRVSAGVLEIIGVPVERYGNILELGGRQVAVAEACSGLRMVLAFLVVAGFAAFVIRRPRWQKVAVVLSSVPIAVLCNVVRIVVTAILYHGGYERLAQGTLHEAVGLLMMPAALCLILLELRVMSKLAPVSSDAEARGLACDAFRGMSARGIVTQR